MVDGITGRLINVTVRRLIYGRMMRLIGGIMMRSG